MENKEILDELKPTLFSILSQSWYAKLLHYIIRTLIHNKTCIFCMMLTARSKIATAIIMDYFAYVSFISKRETK